MQLTEAIPKGDIGNRLNYFVFALVTLSSLQYQTITATLPEVPEIQEHHKVFTVCLVHIEIGVAQADIQIHKIGFLHFLLGIGRFRPLDYCPENVHESHIIYSIIIYTYHDRNILLGKILQTAENCC